MLETPFLQVSPSPRDTYKKQILSSRLSSSGGRAQLRLLQKKPN